jgi:DNA polymerase-3 subunit chi
MRVDFYILSGSAPDARERLSCRLAEKAYKLGHRVYLHAESPAQAQRLDELLWTFRDGSFVPHALEGDRVDPPPPILIGSSEAAARDADLLITLSASVPPFYERFPRVAEIVDQTEDSRRAGRERFRFYRERGLEPQSHPLS